MSRNVDERVVSMKFDNAQFEQETKKTMSTLDKLKSALNFKDHGKGIDTINKGFKNFDARPMSNGIETVNARLSVMQMVGMSAINNLVTGCMNLAGSFAKVVTQQEAMHDGFSEYELEMNSIQTMLANTEKYGTTLEDVKKTLAELNEYADKTVYSFSDMTNAIGKFTTAGVSLEDSTTAIKGLSNLAASVSADNATLARAEYQVSQGLATGAFKLMDWKSLENAGMAGQKVQDTMIDIARKHGIAIDQMIADEGSFRETLKSGWLTTDIFLEAMKRFANDKTMLDAATKVRTFSKMIDTLKESLGTGWADTFRTIIGDFNEATKLWTTLTNFVQHYIDLSAKARNDMFTGWADLGGRDWALAGLWEALNGIFDILQAVKEGFAEVFPPATGETLAMLSEKFYQLMHALRPTPELLEFIKAKVRDFATILKNAFSIIRSVMTLLSPFVSVLIQIGSALFQVGAQIMSTVAPAIARVVQQLMPFVTMLAQITGLILMVPLAAFSYALEHTGDVIAWLSDKMQMFMNMIRSIPLANNIISGIENFASSLMRGEFSVKDFVNSVMNYLENLNLKTVFDQATTAAEGFLQAIEAFGQSIGVNLKPFTDFARAMGDFVLCLEPAQAIVLLITGTFTFSLLKITNVVSEFVEVIGGVADALTGVFESITDVFLAYKKVIMGDLFLKMAASIAIVAGSLYLLSKVPVADLERVGVVVATIFVSMAAAVTAMSFAMKKMDPVQLTAMAQAFSATGVLMMGFSSSIFILAAAMKTLTEACDENDLNSILAGFTTLVGIMAVFGVEMAALSVWMGTVGLKTTAFIIAFALAINLMVKSFEKLASIAEDTKNFQTIAQMFSLLMAAFGFAVGAGRGGGKGGISGVLNFDLGFGVQMLAFVGAIYVFLVALDKVAKLLKSGEDYTQVLVTIAGIFSGLFVVYGLFTMLMKYVGKIGRSGVGLGLGMLSLMSSMFIMVQVADQLNKLQLDDDAIARTVKFVTGIGMIMSVMMVASQWSHRMVSAGFGLLLISGAMAAMIVVAQMIDDYIHKYPDSEKNMRLFAGIFVTFGAVMSALLVASGKAQGAAGMMIPLAITFSVLVGAAALLSMLDPEDYIPAVLALSGLILALGVAIGLIGNMFKGINGLNLNPKKILSLIVVAVFLFTLASTIGALAELGGDWENIAAAAIGLGVAFSAIAGMSQFLKRINIDLKSMGKLLLFVTAMGGIIWALSTYMDDWQKALAGAIGLAPLILAVGVCTKLMNGVYPPHPESIFAVALIGAFATGAVIILSHYVDDIPKALAGAVGLAALIVALGACGRLINGIQPANWVTLGQLGLILVAGWITMDLLAKMGGDVTAMVGGAIGLASIIAALGFAGRQLSGIVPADWTVLAQLGGVLVLATAALVALSIMPIQNVITSVIALGALIFWLGFVANAAATLPIEGAQRLLQMSLSLIPAALAMRMLADMDWTSILVAAVALAGVIFAMSKAVTSMSALQMTGAIDTKMFIALTGGLMILALGLTALATQNWQSILAAAGMMILVMGALALVMNNVNVISPTMGATFAIYAAAVSAMALALTPLASMDVGSILAAAGAIGILVGVFALIGSLAGPAGGAGIASVGVALLTLIPTILAIGAAALMITPFVMAFTECLKVVGQIVMNLVTVVFPLIIDAINTIATSLTTIVSIIGETIVTTINSIGQSIENIVVSTGEAILNIINGIATGIVNVLSTCGSVVTSIVSTISNGIIGILNAINGIIVSLSTVGMSIAAIISSIGMTISSVILSIGTSISTVVTSISTGITSILNSINNIVLSATAMGPVIIGIIQSIGLSIESLVLTTGQTIIMVVQTIATSIISIVQSIQTSIESIVNTIAQAIILSVNTVAMAFTTIGTVILTIVQAIAQSVLLVVQGIAVSVITVVTSIATSIMSVISTIMLLIQSAGDTISSTVNNIVAEILNLIQGAANTITDIINSITNGIKGIFDSIGGIFESMGNGVKTFAESLGILKENLPGVVELLPQFIDSLKKISIADNIFSELATKLVAEIKALQATLTTEINSTCTALAMVANAGAIKVGADFCGGFVTGIKNNRLNVWNECAALGKLSIDAIRDAIDSHSDSKETIAVGEDYDGGLMTGIKSKAGEVAGTVKTFAKDNVLDPLSQKLEEGSGQIGNAVSNSLSGLPAICGNNGLMSANAWNSAFSSNIMNVSGISGMFGNVSANGAARLSKNDREYIKKFGKEYKNVANGKIGYKVNVSLSKGGGPNNAENVSRVIAAEGKDATEALNNLQNKYAETIKATQSQTEANKAEANSFNELAKKLGMNTDEFGKNADATNKATDAQNAFGGAADKAGKSAGGAGKGISDETNAMKDLEETIKGQINIFEEFDASTDLTKEKLLANMKSQIDGVINWSTKLSELAHKGVDQGLLQKLADMGPQGWKYVNAFSTMTAEELQEANKLWDQSLRLPESAAMQIGLNFNMAGQMATKGFVEGLDPNCGNAIAQAMGQNTLDSLMTALDAHSPSRRTQEIGDWADQGFYNGINGKIPLVMTLVKTFGRQLTEAFRKEVSIDKWKSIGTDAMLGFQAGIKSKLAQIKREVAQAGKEITKSLKEVGMKEKSPSKSWEEIGENGMLGLDSGIMSMISKVQKDVDEAGFDITDSMSYIMDSVADVLENGVDPTITPTMNLTRLNSQAGIINSLFADRQIRANMTGNVAMAGAGGGGTSYNITINSTAMDPTSLAKEIERIIIRR